MDWVRWEIICKINWIKLMLGVKLNGINVGFFCFIYIDCIVVCCCVVF